MHLRRQVIPPLLLPAVLLLACGPAARDAASAPEWSLSAEPELTVGEDGTPQGELDRVVAALPLPAQELAVVDAGHREIRIFATDGSYRRTLGGPGSGPGEFNLISWATREGDTLVVYDVGHRRATLLGLDGTVHATITPRVEGQFFVLPVARLASGRWLVSANLTTQRETVPVGVFRDSSGFGLLDASAVGSIAFFHRVQSPPLVAVAGQNAIVPARFGAWAVARRAGSRIIAADAETGLVHLFCEDGTAESTFTLPMPRRPLPAAEVDRLRAEALAAASNPERRLFAEARFAQEAVPAELPVFSNVLADETGALWFEQWEAAPAGTLRYDVVDATGAWIARVTMPPGFQPHAVGRNWVLGVHRDADGVQRVMRYGLRRGR